MDETEKCGIILTRSPKIKAMMPLHKVIRTDGDRKLKQSISQFKRTDSLPGEYRMLFQRTMVDWYEKNQRGYAWRGQADPYKILVAEIMLQQTNADKVEPVYRCFVQQYPSIKALVQSDLEALKAVLRPLGLGYRVARLKNIAEKLVAEHGGEVPLTEEALLALPGVGRYVANAVLCFAYARRVALVDVNVIRLYDRVFGFQSQRNRPRNDNEVWEFATKMLPQTNFKEYNLALLDFTARICAPKKPKCAECPVTGICLFYARGCETDGS